MICESYSSLMEIFLVNVLFDELEVQAVVKCR